MNWNLFRHSNFFNHFSTTSCSKYNLPFPFPYSIAMWDIFETMIFHFLFYIITPPPLSSSLPGFFILQVSMQILSPLCISLNPSRCQLPIIYHLHVIEQDLPCAPLIPLWIRRATAFWNPQPQCQRRAHLRGAEMWPAWDKYSFSFESSLTGLFYHFRTRKQRWGLRGKYQAV